MTLPIGAKSAPAKAPAKSASIGASVPPKGKAKAKAKNQGGSTPIGASSTAKQGAAVRSEPVITSDTALEFLKNAPATQSFADYQQVTQGASAGTDAQDAQNVQDDQAAQGDQTAQDEQIAKAVQADLDAQAVQDATATDPDQPANPPALDEDDDAAMQQALLISRQQAQTQGSDPQAASSAGATQSTEQELQHELQVGMDYQMEVQTLQMKMSQGTLRPDDVARYRTVSQLWSANQARVAELCERQVHESIAQQSRSTRAILGSLRLLNISKANAPAVHPRIQRELAQLLRLENRAELLTQERHLLRYWGRVDLRRSRLFPKDHQLVLQRDEILGQNPCQFKAGSRHQHPPKARHNLT